MLTLYYAPGTCALAVHVVLEWTGVTYQAERVDQHSPEFRRINPAAAVPVLRLDDGTILTQAEAILRFVAGTNPAADLLDDRTPKTAAELDRWSSFLTGDLHPAFFPIFNPGRYTTATDEAALAAVVTAGIALARTKVGLLDEHLRDREWLVGSKRTIVDAYALPMLNWAAAKFPDGLAPFPRAEAYHQRQVADPVAARIMAAEKATA